MDNRIVVLGSLHTDLIIKVDSIPSLGETVLGKSFLRSPGGKGANQAVAAAKLGANVVMIGRIGSDFFGHELIKNIRRFGVNTEYLVEDESTYTGVALIMVDNEGNNIIAVASGADMNCCKDDVYLARRMIEETDVLLIQLEIPLSVVQYAIDLAYNYGVRIILNPAPAQKLPNSLLKKIDILIPNESEAEVLSGMRISNLSSAKNAAFKILDSGVSDVIVTMGREGALMVNSEKCEKSVHVKGVDVKAIDTTGAGDAFCGAIAVAVSSGMDLVDAVRYANIVGALTTRKIGAQEAMPTERELNDYLRSNCLRE
jgi:ribokinase